MTATTIDLPAEPTNYLGALRYFPRLEGLVPRARCGSLQMAKGINGKAWRVPNRGAYA